MRGTVAAGKNIWLCWGGRFCHDGGMKNTMTEIVGLAMAGVVMLALAVGSAQSVFSQEATGAKEALTLELAILRESHEKQKVELDEELAQRSLRLREKYGAALQRLESAVATDGDLESLVAVQSELKQVLGGVKADELNKVPATNKKFASLRLTFLKEQKIIEESIHAKIDARINYYLPKLDELKVRFTKKKMVTEALAVKLEMDATRSLLREPRVTFFGIADRARRVVFIVDFSNSMNTGGRIFQLKKKLDTSLSKLPGGVSYNVIFYSHRPWLGGENAGSAPFRDWENPTDRVPWLKATKENIQRSREQVSAMQLGGATNWIPPVRLALAMTPRPNVIWLLTDGEATDREEMIVRMKEINPSNVRINTIGLEIGGSTFQSLIEIAEMTNGKYSIAMGGQFYTGAAARKFTAPEYSPKN